MMVAMDDVRAKCEVRQITRNGDSRQREKVRHFPEIGAVRHRLVPELLQPSCDIKHIELGARPPLQRVISQKNAHDSVWVPIILGLRKLEFAPEGLDQRQNVLTVTDHFLVMAFFDAIRAMGLVKRLAIEVSRALSDYRAQKLGREDIESKPGDGSINLGFQFRIIFCRESFPSQGRSIEVKPDALLLNLGWPGIGGRVEHEIEVGNLAAGLALGEEDGGIRQVSAKIVSRITPFLCVRDDDFDFVLREALG